MRASPHPARSLGSRRPSSALLGAGHPGQERAHHHGGAPDLSLPRAGRRSGRRSRRGAGLQALDRGHGLAGASRDHDATVRQVPRRGGLAVQVQSAGGARVLHAARLAPGRGALDVQDRGKAETPQPLRTPLRAFPRSKGALWGPALGRGVPPGASSLTAALTFLALVAFASNSILCRLALASREIDPATFTLTRLASGALVLLVVHAIATRSFTRGDPARRAANARPL